MVCGYVKRMEDKYYVVGKLSAMQMPVKETGRTKGGGYLDIVEKNMHEVEAIEE